MLKLQGKSLPKIPQGIYKLDRFKIRYGCACQAVNCFKYWSSNVVHKFIRVGQQ